MERSPNDFDTVMQKLQAYFPNDGALLDWDTVDRLEALPYYIETADFLCVHAGIPIGEGGRTADPSSVMKELLIYDRVFKNADVRHSSPGCVFFGHTPTSYLCGEPKILAYLRSRKAPPYALQDFCKVHLDTGACDSGVLGCFCLDTCKTHYIKKRDRS